MKIKIERLKPANWEEFYRCFKQILEGDFPGYPKKAKRSFSDEVKLRNAFVKKKRSFWVAKLEDKVAGFLIAISSPSGVTFINWLGVKKEFRGQGIGASLVETWEKWAKKRGCHKLRIQTSKIENRAFFKRLGFRLEGKKENDRYHLDFWIFGKIINE